MNVVVEFLWLRGRLCCVCAGLWHFETKEVSTLVSAVESMWSKSGPVAQRIRHLTTNQGIAGSSPAKVESVMVLWLGYLALTPVARVGFPVTETLL